LKRLIIAESAHEDLRSIHDYIAKDDAAAADRWIDTLVKNFDALSAQPGIGQKRDALKRGFRSITEGEYIIFYRVNEQSDFVEIARVLHGKRDLRKAFSESDVKPDEPPQSLL
jgi:plasmid stabilization system protein ParE